MQGVIQPGDHARGVAEGRVGSEVLDPFAIDPNLARAAQAFQVLLTGQGRRVLDALISLILCPSCFPFSVQRSMF